MTIATFIIQTLGWALALDIVRTTVLLVRILRGQRVPAREWLERNWFRSSDERTYTRGDLLVYMVGDEWRAHWKGRGGASAPHPARAVLGAMVEERKECMRIIRGIQ